MTADVAPASGPVSGAPDPATRILLVDDDLINQKVMVNLLKRRGWGAVAVPNGIKCLEALAGRGFDLVLLDIQMPEMDGYATALKIREQEGAQSLAPVPIVALTTVSQPGTREKCLECGMQEHLTKPVNTQQLYATIERLLNLPSA